jgi:hypothetical protein
LRSFEENKKKKTKKSDAPSAPPHSPYPATSHIRYCPTGLYPLKLIPGGDKAHAPFRVSEFKEINKDLGNYTENPNKYIQAFREFSQNFELNCKDIMLLLLDPYCSGETAGTRSSSQSWR